MCNLCRPTVSRMAAGWTDRRADLARYPGTPRSNMSITVDIISLTKKHNC